MPSQKPTNIEPTPENAGLTLTLQLTVYDKGLIQLDGVPQEDVAGTYVALARKIDVLWKQHERRVRNRRG